MRQLAMDCVIRSIHPMLFITYIQFRYNMKCFQLGLKPFLHHSFPWPILISDAFSSVLVSRVSAVHSFCVP
jgi:hypothetical protein